MAWKALLLGAVMLMLQQNAAYARLSLPVCTVGDETCQLPCGPCNTRAFIYETSSARLAFTSIVHHRNTTVMSFELRMPRDALSRECPMLSVALRTRVEARLLPVAGPAPQPRQHRGCSPVLGLKHSVEWALPPPAADGLQPEVQLLVAVFAGEQPPAALLKRASRIRILTARHEAIDIHYPLHTTFFYVVTNKCYCSHGFLDPVDPTVHRTAPTWTAEDYASLWQSHHHEESYAVESIEGAIPADLEGTFYRTGPGMFDINGNPLHVFDGHGLVASIAIRDGAAWYRSRYVRTPAYVEEVEQGRGVRYRGFGTNKPGGWLANVFDIRDKPVANTALYEWDGKLWALWEAHRPFVLDPVTLETLGEDDIGGLLRDAQPFCAHPQLDIATGRLVGFSLGLRHAEGKLHVYELEPEGDVAVHKSLRISLNPPLYVHDFAVTPNWYVFYEAPLKVNFRNFAKYLLGTSDQTKMVAFDRERPGRWMLVPRGGGDKDVVYIDTPPQFIFHYAAAVETAEGNVVVDACVFDAFAPGDFELRDPATIDKSTLRRSVLSPSRRVATSEELFPRSADLPIVNEIAAGRGDYRFCWLAASSTPAQHFPYQSVVKLDVSTRQTAEWTAPDGCFVGEPLYVSRTQSHAQPAGGSGNGSEPAGSGKQHSPTADEDDGYVVTLMHDARKRQSSLVILDAKDPAAGPLALVNLKRSLPFAFHCLWSAQYHGPS